MTIRLNDDHRSPDRPRMTMAVSKLYTDNEGKGWVELHYPGTRPNWLPANPVPYEDLKNFIANAYISPARMEATEAIEAKPTIVRDKASEFKMVDSLTKYLGRHRDQFAVPAFSNNTRWGRKRARTDSNGRPSA